MSIFFNPDEVLEMAEQIERNGARFYRQAAQGAQDVGVRELLQGLAAMEDGHEKLFAKMRANLKKEEIDFNADVAIDLEKESIVFYLGMKNGVNNKTYRDRIEEIIKEEMKHIVSLSATLSSLKK
jgi:rubrerythrin